MNLTISGTVSKSEIENFLRAEIEKETGKKVKSLRPKCGTLYSVHGEDEGSEFKGYDFELESKSITLDPFGR